MDDDSPIKRLVAEFDSMPEGIQRVIANGLLDRDDDTVKPRICFYVPVDQHDEHGWIPSIVTENEPGHAPLRGNGAFAVPWRWGDTYEKATAHCARENERLGLAEQDVTNIVISSMRLTLR